MCFETLGISNCTYIVDCVLMTQKFCKESSENFWKNILKIGCIKEIELLNQGIYFEVLYKIFVLVIFDTLSEINYVNGSVV